MKKLPSLSRWIDNLRFRHKMILLSVTAVLFVGAISVIGYQISLNKYNEFLHQQTSSSLILFSRQIRQEMVNIEDLSNMAAVDSSIQTSLAQLLESGGREVEMHRARVAISDSLYRYLTPEILCITVIPMDDISISCGLDSSKEAAHVIEAVKDESPHTNGAGFWMSNEREDGTILFVRELRKFGEPDFLKTLGYMIFRVDYDRLIEQAGTGVDIINEQLLVISDNDGNIIYDRNAPDTTEAYLQELRLGKNEDYAIRQVVDSRLFISHTILSTINPQLNIYIGLQYNNIFHSVLQARIATFVTLVLAVIFAILIAGIAVRSINRRFELLVKKFDRFKTGSMEITTSDNEYGSDEFGLLNRHFDDLTVELKHTIEENYVKELLITRAQLTNLEQQIQPHFLYNTLETVNWFAKRCGEENIPVIIEALSTLLRSNISSKEDVVTLKSELEVLGSYVTIQKIRHTDMLEIKYSIDAQTFDAFIPKMSIQPIVENAIIYSMEESIDGCCIVIGSHVSENEVVVTIENNGSQIDEDILEKLRNQTITANGNGIGLINIDSRLKLIFGEQYGLSFVNGDDSVTVEIHLPLHPAKM